MGIYVVYIDTTSSNLYDYYPSLLIDTPTHSTIPPKVHGRPGRRLPHGPYRNIRLMRWIWNDRR